eukprot:scaffold451_cov365-Prasinococcus_capsulatus_cf.AAC.34
MQRHPFSVPSSTPLSRAYKLFRTMGLRHMLVTREQTQVLAASLAQTAIHTQYSCFGDHAI